MIQEFEVPGRLPGANEYTAACRSNARAGGRMKRDAQERVCWAIRAAHLRPMGKVDVSFVWIEPDMRRDKDNVRFAAKFILDALVEMQIIKNDGWRHVGDLSDAYMVNRDNPRVVVRLEESW